MKSSEADTPDYYPEDRQALATPVDRTGCYECEPNEGERCIHHRAAIDDETLHERQVRLNYERPGRAAIDDEAKGAEWRDDSGHWIGGNVGMPEVAIDDEAKG